MLVLGCTAPHVSLPLLPSFPPTAAPAVLWTETFDALQPQLWRHVEVHGHTSYEEALLEDRRCLKAHSEGAASMLLRQARFDPKTYQWISWDWRVDRLVANEALAQKEGSDASARVYVYFETPGLPWQKRNIDYVWSATLPVGTILSSAFSPASKIIVVESGAAALGQWRTVERNLDEDYEQCFGEDPPEAIAIGLMTDTDNTQGEAVAYYDDLRISKHRRP